MTSITSATVPANAAAIRLFAGLGFTCTHTVDVWPSFAALTAYERAVGFQPGVTPMRWNAPHMLDHIPGAHDQLASTDSAACSADDWCWSECKSQAELEAAVASIRRRQRQLNAGLRAVPEPEAPQSWLPWAYEMQPTDSAWCKEQLQAGAVWLLRRRNSSHAAGGINSNNSLSSSSSGGSSIGGSNRLIKAQGKHGGGGGTGDDDASSRLTDDEDEPLVWEGGSHHHALQCEAVVVLADSAEFRRRAASVLVADSSATGELLRTALQFAASREPHFVAFCDRGSCHGSVSDPAESLPELLTATGPASCFLVYAQRCCELSGGTHELPQCN